MGVQEFIRRETQAVLQSQHVVRVEKQVEVPAALVEACQAGMTTEPKGIIVFQPPALDLVDLVVFKVFHVAFQFMGDVFSNTRWSEVTDHFRHGHPYPAVKSGGLPQ